MNVGDRVAVRIAQELGGAPVYWLGKIVGITQRQVTFNTFVQDSVTLIGDEADFEHETVYEVIYDDHVGSMPVDVHEDRIITILEWEKLKKSLDRFNFDDLFGGQ